MDVTQEASRSVDVGTKVAMLLQKRMQFAQEHYRDRLAKAYADNLAGVTLRPDTLPALWQQWNAYATDAAQRTILFWDTLRQRGNNFLEHLRQGMPPVLHFEYETIVDGRQLPRPVNYALLRIVPPAGVKVYPTHRPYVIIDPRAGHGPGIGGFKDDSQVGVALRAGHPVYFVIFYRDPEPGQTLLDVCEAEKLFVKEVRARHPDSPKPAIVGNCQGGWAAMMLASADPDDTGPIVINGAPMSYWGGAWAEGAGDNPMRYSGGNLGGTWLASLTADMGNGIFDGAYLVENFENLDPANNYWDKYYNLYSKVDTEPQRFLEFERWFGGYYLMNREEIEWITRNLFVGNKLWGGATQMKGGKPFDLRDIKSPIVLFASMGDNITPPQQAFNWVGDIYGSTDEIKARGQVIVGLLHESIGHLGIFVSGKVAVKEHREIVSVLDSIEALPPGLYGMQITERRGKDGEVAYDVTFHERRLEELGAKLNRFSRADEKPFAAVEAISDFNQRAYEIFAQPVVQAAANDFTARLLRQFHPLRVRQWSFSDLNPWLAWLKPAADAVAAQRRPAPDDGLAKRCERFTAEAVSAAMDCQRAVRDALSEASFFSAFGSPMAQHLADRQEAETTLRATAADPRELPFVQEALAAIDRGGYAEALARVGALLARKGEPVLLAQLAVKEELIEEYRDLLPAIPRDEWRRIRGEQELIASYEPERAIATLPLLLAEPRERERLLTLFARLMADARVRSVPPSPAQKAMLARLRRVLDMGPAQATRSAPRAIPPAPRRPRARRPAAAH
jgi:pimeloyl-ACP methyl ester carboxylesterase